MADCYSYLYMYFDSGSAESRNWQEDDRTALELDADLAEAHTRPAAAPPRSAIRTARRRGNRDGHPAEPPPSSRPTTFMPGLASRRASSRKLRASTNRQEMVKPDDCQAPSLLASLPTLGQLERAEAAIIARSRRSRSSWKLNSDDSVPSTWALRPSWSLANARRPGMGRRSYDLDPDDPYIIYGIACSIPGMGMTENLSPASSRPSEPAQSRRMDQER